MVGQNWTVQAHFKDSAIRPIDNLSPIYNSSDSNIITFSTVANENITGNKGNSTLPTSIVNGTQPEGSEPQALDVTTNTTADTPVTIQLQVESPSNPDADLIASIVSQPVNGTLGDIDQNTGTVTYTPVADDISTTAKDSFTYKVSDGSTDSNEATVSITINPLGDSTTPRQDDSKPQALDVTTNTTADTPVTIQLQAESPSNPDADLIASIVSQPVNGKLGDIDQNTGTLPTLL